MKTRITRTFAALIAGGLLTSLASACDLTGFASEGGLGVADAQIRIFGSGDTDVLGSTVSAPDGKFRISFRSAPAGLVRVVLNAKKAGFKDRNLLLHLDANRCARDPHVQVEMVSTGGSPTGLTVLVLPLGGSTPGSPLPTDLQDRVSRAVYAGIHRNNPSGATAASLISVLSDTEVIAPTNTEALRRHGASRQALALIAGTASADAESVAVQSTVLIIPTLSGFHERHVLATLRVPRAPNSPVDTAQISNKALLAYAVRELARVDNWPPDEQLERARSILDLVRAMRTRMRANDPLLPEVDDLIQLAKVRSEA